MLERPGAVGRGFAGPSRYTAKNISKPNSRGGRRNGNGRAGVNLLVAGEGDLLFAEDDDV